MHTVTATVWNIEILKTVYSLQYTDILEVPVTEVVAVSKIISNKVAV